jgi:hypothetical protein
VEGLPSEACCDANDFVAQLGRKRLARRKVSRSLRGTFQANVFGVCNVAHDREDSGSPHPSTFVVVGMRHETKQIDLFPKMARHPCAKPLFDARAATDCESSTESGKDRFDREEYVRVLFEPECGNQIEEARNRNSIRTGKRPLMTHESDPLEWRKTRQVRE